MSLNNSPVTRQMITRCAVCHKANNDLPRLMFNSFDTWECGQCGAVTIRQHNSGGRYYVVGLEAPEAQRVMRGLLRIYSADCPHCCAILVGVNLDPQITDYRVVCPKCHLISKVTSEIDDDGREYWHATAIEASRDWHDISGTDSHEVSTSAPAPILDIGGAESMLTNVELQVEALLAYDTRDATVRTVIKRLLHTMYSTLQECQRPILSEQFLTAVVAYDQRITEVWMEQVESGSGVKQTGHRRKQS